MTKKSGAISALVFPTTGDAKIWIIGPASIYSIFNFLSPAKIINAATALEGRAFIGLTV